MNKWILGFGLFLLLMAPVLLTFTKTTRVAPKATEGPASSNDPSEIKRWECAGNFTKDDVIMVELLPDIFWAQNPAAFDLISENGTSFNVLYVDINITDPQNSISQYEVWLHFDQTANRFSVYNATALSFGGGISSTVLLPNKYNFTLTFIAGMAQLNGTYVANVVSAGALYDYRTDGTYPPAVLELFYLRTTFELSKPYADLLYAGYATIPIGGTLLVYGIIWRTKPHRKASNRNRDSDLPKSRVC